MSANWKPGQKHGGVERDDDDLDDMLDDLLAESGPSKKTTTQTSSFRKNPGKSSGLDDDFYKNLAAGAGEVTESDISEADPVAMANTMDDLDDMDAMLFGGKKENKTTGASVVKTGGATKPANSIIPKNESQAKDKASSKEKKIDFDFDEDDPLKGLLSDEEDSFATKKKTPGGNLKKPSSGGNQQAMKAPSPGQIRKQEDSSVKAKAEPEPSGGRRGNFAKKKQTDISFDDDDVLGTMGLEDGPSKTAAKAASSDEAKSGKSVMDSLLGKSSVAHHLERPGTGEKRKEFVLDKKYTKPQAKEDDFVFGSYAPSAGTTSSRPSSRRSVRFENDDDDDPLGLSVRPKSASASARSKPPPTSGSDPGDWLGIGSSSDKAKPRPKSAGDAATKTKSSPAADWLGLGGDSDKETDTKNDVDDWLGLSAKEKPQPEHKKPTTAESQLTDSSRVATAETVRPNSGYSLSDEEYLAMGDQEDEDIFNKPENVPKDSLKSSPSVPKSEDLFNPPPKSEEASVFNWESSRSRPPLMQRPATRSGNRSAAASSQPDVPPPSTSSRVMTSPSPLNAAQPAPASDSLASTLQHLQTVEQAERQTKPPQPAPTSTAVSAAAVSPYGVTAPIPAVTGRANMDSLRQHQQQILQQKQMELQMEIQRQQEEWRQQEIQQQQQQQQAMQQAQQQLLQQQMMMSLQPVGSSFVSPLMAGSGASQSDLEAKIKRLEVEKEQLQLIFDGCKQRHQEEIAAIESSYKTRLDLLEESFQRREGRLKEENELLATQNMSKLRQTEQEKTDLMSSLYKRLEESDRDKYAEIQRLKDLHRQAIDDLQRDHVETLNKLKQVSQQEMETVTSTQTHSKALLAVVDQIQNNASELGSLQQRVGQQHNTQLDNREAAAKLMDQNLKTLQERLTQQQREYEQERARLNGLVTKLEMQLTEQTRHLEEEKWRVRQEESKLQALQTSAEQEKAIVMEKLQRQRNDLQSAKDNLIEEQKTLLAQLCEERRALAEQRSQFELSQKLHHDQQHRESIKTAQVIAERDGTLRQISEEKAGIQIQLQELQREREKLSSEQTALEHEKFALSSEKQKLEQLALQLKTRSSEIEEMCMSAAEAREEGHSALMAAKRLESEQTGRLQSVQAQIHTLREKEKSIAQERLFLAKEKQAVEVQKSKMMPNIPFGMQPHQSALLGTPMANGSMMPNNMSMGNASMSMMAPSMSMMPGASPSMLVPNVANTLNNVSQATSAMQVDHSVRMWKISAEKDKAYLEEEGMFLQALKHSPYSAMV